MTRRIYASVVAIGDVLRLPDGDHKVTSVRLVGEDVRIELGPNSCWLKVQVRGKFHEELAFWEQVW